MKNSNYIPNTNNYDKEEHKVKEIASRFNALRDTVEHQRKKRVTEVEEFLGILEIKSNELANDVLYERLKGTLNELIDKTCSESELSDNLDTTYSKQLKTLSSNFETQIEDLKSGNKNLWNDFLKETEEKFFTLNINVNKQKKKFNDQIEQKKNDIIDVLDSLNEGIENEKCAREEGNSEITNNVIENLEKIKEDINIERKVREETTEKLKNFIEETHYNLQKEIDIEKKNREFTNNSLLNLLEEACNKIEKTFACK